MNHIPAPLEFGYTTTTDVPLYWARYGPANASPLLVLHGGPGASHDYLLPQMLTLGDAGRGLVFYDQRGGGRSPADSRAPITWRTHVDDVARVVAELSPLHGAPLEIVGYSWGGLLALLYAIEASAGRVEPRPSRLVLLDPAPVTRAYRDTFEAEFARRQAGEAVQALRRELAQSGLRERSPSEYRQRAFELSVAGYFADPDAARALTPFRVVARVQHSVWESLGDFDLLRPGALDQVHCPALVVHGREDPIPLESSTSVARTLGARLVVLEQCGHVPYVEQPALLFRAIGDFLQRSV
ncbi:MAG TPA: alpha/beta fold hydrolase [Gemmatimonadaceae bacterium]|nr:alpha/beta fold hydrolase [Gemmatimonadaceae bacterium]